MAHFVKLDENNIVVNGFAIHDNELKDNENNEQEILGIKFCVKLFGEGNYKQTFYDGTSRKNYAGVGYTYDETRDAFIGPKPYASWTLNETTCKWEAPITHPTITTYEDGTYTQADADADVYPVGHEQEGQRVNSFVVGDTKNFTYIIIWDETGQKWTAKDRKDPQNNFNWDEETPQWIVDNS